MELLLILSALLNAATGVFASARGPEATPRHEAAAEAVAVARSAAIVVAAAKPAPQTEPVVRAPAPLAPAVPAAPAAAAPLDTERLNE